MAGLLKMVSVWTGFAGAPGYTNLYAHHNGVSAQEVANQFADDIHDFWNTVNGYVPAVVDITVGPSWQSIDIESGDVLDEGTVETPPASVAGNLAGGFAGNVGLALNWQTGTFIKGRRLKGRTYLVPLGGIFEGDGTPSASSIAAIGDAATALLEGSSNMAVWHRPKAGAGGSWAQITGVTITDRAAVLRSRSV